MYWLKNAKNLTFQKKSFGGILKPESWELFRMLDLEWVLKDLLCSSRECPILGTLYPFRELPIMQSFRT